MDISYVGYQVFYKHLLEKVKSRLSKKELENLRKSEASIWDEAQKAKLFKEVFGTSDLSKEYLYKKALEYVPERVGIGVIRDSIMINALGFLGTVIPKNIPRSKYADPATHARLLFDEFINQHLSELNDDDNEPTNSSNNFLEKMYHTNTSDLQTTSSNEQIISNIISDFYHNITVGKLEDAWNLLSKQFQEKTWKGNVAEFTLGYTNTVSCTNVHVWDVTVQRDTASCKLFYIDRVNVATNTSLTDIDTLPLSKFDIFVSRMREFIQNVKEANFKGVDETEIAKFFQSTVSEYIWVRNKIDPEEVRKLFPRQVSEEVPRLYNVTLVKSDDSWCIRSITPIKSQLHR